MEKNKTLEQNLDSRNEKLHPSDVIDQLEQLILFAQFVQNDYYGNGIESADIIVDKWLKRKKK